MKPFRDETAILQDNNNIWNVAVYSVNKASEVYEHFCLIIGSTILGCPELKYTLIRVGTFYIIEKTKNYIVLENLNSLKIRHTFLTNIFARIKYTQSYKRDCFSKKCEFWFCNNRYFRKLNNILVMKLLKNTNMIIPHKIYN